MAPRGVATMEEFVGHKITKVGVASVAIREDDTAAMGDGDGAGLHEIGSIDPSIATMAIVLGHHVAFDDDFIGQSNGSEQHEYNGQDAHLESL